MPRYIEPEYNLTCNIWTSANFAALPRLTGVRCNLAYGRRYNAASTGGTGVVGVPLICMTLLLPAATDVRGRWATTEGDGIEVPSGSGRYYIGQFADNVGMGFPNEHKILIMTQRVPFKTPDT